MGIVTTEITASNRQDVILAARGFMKPDAVRTLTLDNVLVDTGATTLCLPADVIAQLGLEYQPNINVDTASGSEKWRMFREAHLFILDREGTFDCIELPEGREPLLGVVPMEMLGLEPDLKNRVLRALPMDDSGSYLLAYTAGHAEIKE